MEGTWCFPSREGFGVRGLRAQLRLLRRAATVVPLAEALADLRHGRRLPPRAVALTFDDGYADNLTLAVPMLERFGLPATFFLVPDLLSGCPAAWWETAGWAFRRTSRTEVAFGGGRYPLSTAALARQAYETVSEALKRRNRARRDADVAGLVEQLAPTGAPPGPELFLDWAGAAELVRRGFAVGSHSMSHAILSEESAAEQDRDLVASRAQLADRLGVPVPLLAYPNGTRRDFDATTIAAAQRAGYRAAVSTLDGFTTAATPPYEVRRAVLYPERGPLDLVKALVYARRADGTSVNPEPPA